MPELLARALAEGNHSLQAFLFCGTHKAPRDGVVYARKFSLRMLMRPILTFVKGSGILFLIGAANRCARSSRGNSQNHAPPSGHDTFRPALVSTPAFSLRGSAKIGSDSAAFWRGRATRRAKVQSGDRAPPKRNLRSCSASPLGHATTTCMIEPPCGIVSGHSPVPPKGA